jgi:hypothetical protein
MKLGVKIAAQRPSVLGHGAGVACDPHNRLIAFGNDGRRKRARALPGAGDERFFHVQYP